jgi:hypothetical protein
VAGLCGVAPTNLVLDVFGCYPSTKATVGLVCGAFDRGELILSG